MRGFLLLTLGGRAMVKKRECNDKLRSKLLQDGRLIKWNVKDYT